MRDLDNENLSDDNRQPLNMEIILNHHSGAQAMSFNGPVMLCSGQ
jgi:hypothetical protein